MEQGYPNVLWKGVYMIRVRKNLLLMSHLSTLDVTLIEEKLLRANHVPGPKCRCGECGKLKHLEDCWILKVGSFYGKSGLNNRNEIKRKTSVQWDNG